MKKLFALVLCILMMLSLALSSFAALDDSKLFRFDNQSTNGINWDWCNNYGYADYAMQFKVEAGEFNGGYMFLYGGTTKEKPVTVELYAWNENVTISKTGKVLDTASFTVNKDAAYTYEFKSAHGVGEYIIVFKGADSGEYMFFADCPAADSNADKVAFYYGEEKNSKCSTSGLYYTGDEFKLATVTKPITKVGFVVAAPEASDSAPNFDMNFATGDIAVQFKTNADFNAVRPFIFAPAAATGNTELTLNLYKWNKNYAESVKAAPVETIKTTTAGDKHVTFELKNSYKGEYLAVISGVSSTDYIIPRSCGESNQAFYFNGEPAAKSFLVGIYIDAFEGGLEAVSESDYTVPSEPTGDGAVIILLIAIVTLAAVVVVKKVKA